MFHAVSRAPGPSVHGEPLRQLHTNWVMTSQLGAPMIGYLGTTRFVARYPRWMVLMSPDRHARTMLPIPDRPSPRSYGVGLARAALGDGMGDHIGPFGRARAGRRTAGDH